MNDTGPQADHLLVAVEVFAGERFWAALERLAGRLGHEEHPRMLHGVAERTDWYAYRCMHCDRPLATMQVQRAPE